MNNPKHETDKLIICSIRTETQEYDTKQKFFGLINTMPMEITTIEIKILNNYPPPLLFS